MNRRRLLAAAGAAALGLSAACTGSRQSIVDERAVRQAAGSVVRVYAGADPTQCLPVGSGWVVRERTFVTTATAVANATITWVRAEDGPWPGRPADVVLYEPALGIAALSLVGLQGHLTAWEQALEALAPLELASAEPDTPAAVLARERAGGLRTYDLTVDATAEREVPDVCGDRRVARRVVELSGSIPSRAVGGPLVDRGGRVIGAPFMSFDDGKALATPSSAVEEALGRLADGWVATDCPDGPSWENRCEAGLGI